MVGQLPGILRRAAWAAAAAMTMGLLVELAQGVTNHGHCRMRDLIPDATGTLIGLLAVAAMARARVQVPGRRTRG